VTSIKRDKSKQYSESSDRCWYLRPDGEREQEDPKAHEKLSRMLKQISDSQDTRRRAMLVYASMYGGSGNINGLLAAGSRTMSTAIGPRAESGLSLNVTRNVIDAAVSKVFSKSQPHLTYTTEGGDYEKQHNAEKLDQGVAGELYRCDGNARMVRAGRDACVFGDGPLRIEADLDARKVTMERLLPGQVLVDEDSDVYDGLPTCFYVLTPIDKFVLAHKYRKDEDKQKAILRLQDDRTAFSSYGFQGTGLQVYVYEGWHVPSGKDASDGRYVCAVGNCTLEDRIWDGGRDNKPPIANFQWSEPLAGYYGQGIAEQGKGIQSELNALARQIQNGHHLITGRWMVEANSKVISQHINNDLSSILRYYGVKPEYVLPVIIQPEIYQHMIWLVGEYYNLAALNQQSAQAQKPAGLDSGEAQRVYADQQTETLLDKGKRYEEFVKECGQLVTDAAQELAAHGTYEVRAQNDDGFETIDWAELDDPDGYQLTVSATSSLPGTISGKIDLAYDVMKLGVFDTGDMTDLMPMIGLPDVLQKSKLKRASYQNVFKHVGEMLRLGTPWMPTPLLNLDEAIALATAMYNLAESKGVDDARLQLVRDFIDECVKLKPQAPALPAAAMAPGQAGMMAPGSPGPAAGAPAAPPLPPVPQAA
jgi:hypothetical protein